MYLLCNKCIMQGLTLDRIAGLFSEPPFSPLVSSPFHVEIVPKSEPGKLRIIHDISYPKN